jgi:hypothetical protein
LKKKNAALIATGAVGFAVLIIVIILSCFFSNRKSRFTSPNKTNLVTISYDFVSRPSVIYNGKKIWEYPGRGFNEEAFFDVIWQSEDEFILRYDDESHNGKYAEEFLIKLE